MAQKGPTIGTREMGSCSGGWGRVFHARKLVVIGRVSGGWVCNTAPPLEDEGEGSESEGEEREKKEEFGDE